MLPNSARWPDRAEDQIGVIRSTSAIPPGSARGASVSCTTTVKPLSRNSASYQSAKAVGA